MRKPRENGLPRNKGCGKVAVRRRAGAGPENLMAKLLQVFFKIGVSEMEDFHGTVREIFGQIFIVLSMWSVREDWCRCLRIRRANWQQAERKK